MKKIFLLSLSTLLITSIFAQDSIVAPAKKKPINLSGRANDHFLLQFGYTGWAGTPDSVNPSGFSKSINVYFMFDFPFKTSPKMSIGIGAGVSTDNITFKETFVGIKEVTSVFQIKDVSDTTHFKKTKLGTAYFEAPIELRYTANPLHSDNSFKFALGVKVGLLMAAKTKNKELQDRNDNTLNPYTMKEISKHYFNTTRLSAHARIGYGHFSLYGSYQLTALFKEGVAAQIRPFSIGLTLSGL
jgi:hypothetical protein